MNKTTTLLTGAVLLTATAAFGQTGPAKPAQEQPTQDAQAGNTPKQGGSSVVIRQSGSGNRAVVRQSANGTTTETVQAQGGTNTVDVRHDGHSTVTIEQREPARPATARPDTTKRNQ